MNYMEIMKWLPHFTATNSLISNYCKYILFGDSYTSAFNGFVLVSDVYTAQHPHMEDKHGNVYSFSTQFDEKIRNVLNNFVPHAECSVSPSLKILDAVPDISYILLSSTGVDMYSISSDLQTHIRIPSAGTNKHGGAFSSKTVSLVMKMLSKTDPVAPVTISLTEEKFPLMKLSNTHTTVIMTGLRVPPDSPLYVWLATQPHDVGE